MDVLEDIFACLDVSANLYIDVSIIFGRQIGTIGHHPAVLLGVILWGSSRPAPAIFGVSEVGFEDGMIAKVLWKPLAACVLIRVPAWRNSACFGSGIMTAIAMEHASRDGGIEIGIQAFIRDLSTDSGVYLRGGKESILRVQYNEDMCMWKTAFLKFYRVGMRWCSA